LLVLVFYVLVHFNLFVYFHFSRFPLSHSHLFAYDIDTWLPPVCVCSIGRAKGAYARCASWKYVDMWIYGCSSLCHANCRMCQTAIISPKARPVDNARTSLPTWKVKPLQLGKITETAAYTSLLCIRFSFYFDTRLSCTTWRMRNILSASTAVGCWAIKRPLYINFTLYSYFPAGNKG